MEQVGIIQIAEANLLENPCNKIHFIYSIYLLHTELRMYFFFYRKYFFLH